MLNPQIEIQINSNLKSFLFFPSVLLDLYQTESCQGK